MKPVEFLLFDRARADKSCLRSEVVRAVLNIVWRVGERYGPLDAITVLHTALAIAERNAGVTRAGSNKVLSEVRRSVDAAYVKLGDKATALEVALELDLLSEERGDS